MGWDFCDAWTKKSQVVAARLEDAARNGYKVLAHKSVKSGLWCVLQSENGTPVITFDLMERENGSWGYKNMDESMYPYYFDCPVKFLDLAPETCHEWRNCVRAHHARKYLESCRTD